MTLEIKRGDDETVTVLVTDPDAADAPVDLTGATLTFMVKRRPVDPDLDALLTKTTADGITLSDQTANTGEATIEIDAADTDELARGLFYWELQSVDATDKVKTLAGGRFEIKADLIRES